MGREGHRAAILPAIAAVAASPHAKLIVKAKM
jgi:hypothetical protein